MTQIFVGNLPYSVNESDLRTQFEPYGRVASVRISTDSGTGRPRGFAFINMPSLDDADEAIKHLSGATIGGRRLTINESQSKKGEGKSSSNKAEQARAMTMFEMLRAE